MNRIGRPWGPPVSEALGKARMGTAATGVGTEFVLGRWEPGVLRDRAEAWRARSFCCRQREQHVQRPSGTGRGMKGAEGLGSPRVPSPDAGLIWQALLSGAGIGGTPGATSETGSFSLMLADANLAARKTQRTAPIRSSSTSWKPLGTCLILGKRGPRALWQRDRRTLAPTAAVVAVGSEGGMRGAGSRLGSRGRRLGTRAAWR